MTQSTLPQIQTLHLVAGAGVPGAPALNLDLIYNTDVAPPTLDGKGLITQAVTPPGGRIEVHGIHGEVTEMRTSPGMRMINLRGVCSEPPTTVLFPFSAVFVVDRDWNGEGSFTYGGKKVVSVPIRAER